MKLDFSKQNGLIPAIVQDENSAKVLMLGYMNKEAIEVTKKCGNVTFFSRSKNRLWTKGETSGHFMKYVNMVNDCDNDTLLVKAVPLGPVCHTGADTCFKESNSSNLMFIDHLMSTIKSRREKPTDGSYTSSLFKKGINKIAQKVGEEAVELIIESKDNNEPLFIEEAADLLYHYLVLLEVKGTSLDQVVNKLQNRHKN